MEHYANDVIFASPVATQLVPSSNGVIRGKAALRDYWAEGLRKFPDLHFELKETYVGVGIVVINYVNQTGALACEVLEFEVNKWCAAMARTSSVKINLVVCQRVDRFRVS